MLASYKTKRLADPILRKSVRKRYLIAPFYGVICAVGLHYNNWIWFKQQYIYENDGTEKDAKWRQYRSHEFVRHFRLATNILGIGFVTYVWVLFRRRFINAPRGVPTHGIGFQITDQLKEMGIGLPVGGLPIELLYYAWHVYETELARKRAIHAAAAISQNDEEGSRQLGTELKA